MFSVLHRLCPIHDIKHVFQIKQEIDTTGFSFEAMLTMNTAKVKKSKKIKSSTVNEHDESVLEFEVRF